VVHVAPGTAVVPVVADVPPAGAFTLWITESADPEVVRSMRARLRDEGQPAWIAATLVQGESRYTVAVGGYATAEEADAAGAAAHAVTGLPIVVRELDGGVIGAPVID
jgi:septal ring-binding cell division protein DamX